MAFELLPEDWLMEIADVVVMLLGVLCGFVVERDNVDKVDRLVFANFGPFAPSRGPNA